MQRIHSSSLTGRLVRVFLLQALAISLAVVVGVYAAARVVEGVLVEEALDGEAAHFWTLYDADPDVPRPNTLNMLGYLERPVGGDAVPTWLGALQPGFRRVERPGGEAPLVHVSEHDGVRLYLLFDEIQVSRLAFFFGIAPLSAVLLLIYALTWVGYRLSRSAVSPIVRLAARVEQFDPVAGDPQSLDLRLSGRADAEVVVLAGALTKFVGRLHAFVERERDFTRSASHELRTPLAVLRANADALERRAAGRDDLLKPLSRMQRTIDDMERLIEALLLLAREEGSQPSPEPVVVNDLLAERIDQLRRARGPTAPAVTLQADCRLESVASPRLLAIVLDNLLRNAMDHGGRDIVVTVAPGAVTVADGGAGMDAETRERVWEPFHRGGSDAGGYGLGLAIVRRICERLGWRITLDSAPGAGTRVALALPSSRVLPSQAKD